MKYIFEIVSQKEEFPPSQLATPKRLELLPTFAYLTACLVPIPGFFWKEVEDT